MERPKVVSLTPRHARDIMDTGHQDDRSHEEVMSLTTDGAVSSLEGFRRAAVRERARLYEPFPRQSSETQRQDDRSYEGVLSLTTDGAISSLEGFRREAITIQELNQKIKSYQKEPLTAQQQVDAIPKTVAPGRWLSWAEYLDEEEIREVLDAKKSTAGGFKLC